MCSPRSILGITRLFKFFDSALLDLWLPLASLAGAGSNHLPPFGLKIGVLSRVDISLPLEKSAGVTPVDPIGTVVSKLWSLLMRAFFDFRARSQGGPECLSPSSWHSGALDEKTPIKWSLKLSLRNLRKEGPSLIDFDFF